MNDSLISRQAALDALQEYWDTIKDKHITLDGETAVYADCKRIIKMLPSAQPEEDCASCKHGYFGDRQCDNCRVRYPSNYERRTDGE